MGTTQWSPTSPALRAPSPPFRMAGRADGGASERCSMVLVESKESHNPSAVPVPIESWKQRLTCLSNGQSGEEFDSTKPANKPVSGTSQCQHYGRKSRGRPCTSSSKPLPPRLTPTAVHNTDRPHSEPCYLLTLFSPHLHHHISQCCSFRSLVFALWQAKLSCFVAIIVRRRFGGLLVA